MAIHNHLTDYESKLLDNFDYSKTSAMIFQDESGDMDSEPSYSCDAELDDEIIGKSAIFTTLHSGARRTSEPETSLSLLRRKFVASSVLFHTHTRTVRPVYELSSCQKRKSRREMHNGRIRILLERRKEQILAEVRTEIHEHEFQVDSDRSIQELTGIIDSERREIAHTTAGNEQQSRDHLLLQEQHRDLREAHMKSLYEMEELKRVQGSTFDTISRRRLIENQDSINGFTARIQELQSEVNCLKDLRYLKDAESVRSGLSHVPSQPALLPLFRDRGGMLSRKDKPPDIWDTHGKS